MRKKIYHGCYTVNKDGRRILTDFKNGKKCLLPTAYPFWKRPEDYTNIGVQTRNTVKKKRKCSIATVKKYLDNLQKIKQYLHFLR